MKLSDRFLQNNYLSPKVDYNRDLTFLGDESSFAFGAAVSQLEASKKFKQIFKFHIGDTGPTTPQPIIDVAIEALNNKQTKYAHFLGYPQVRENIARYWTQTRKTEIKKENVMLLPGAKPVIELALQALINPEDEVIIQNPEYPIYASLCQFYTHKKPLEWVARKNTENKNLKFEIEDLKNILSANKNIKLLFLNTPQNPTGLMMDEVTLRQVAELAREYRFMIVFDDIYDRITFENQEHFSILSIPGMLDFTININGCSKNYAMTGWRCGIVVAPEWLIEIFGQLGVNKWSCVSRVNQIAVGTIFGDVDLDGYHYESAREKIEPILRDDLEEYERKGKFLYEAISLLFPFVSTNQPQGAFYIFPNIENILSLSYVKGDLNIKNDKEFSRWLLEEKGIAVMAGSDFGSAGAGYLRLSFAEDYGAHIIPGAECFIETIIELIEKSNNTPPFTINQTKEKLKPIIERNFAL